MATFDAVFVGLTILDIAGRPVVAIPPRGGVAFIEQIRLNPAGTAAGANINAAKLGIRTAAVACLGEDEKADFILASYARLGIDCSLIQRTALKETSATILPIRPNGERPALHCRGASDALFVSEAEFDAVLDCRFLHHGGTGLLAAMDQGQSARLLQAAKARGVTTSFDLIAPNEETLELLRPLLPSVDYFMPSLEEAAFLSGETQPEAIGRFFLALGVGTCILKDGENGSWLIGRDGGPQHISLDADLGRLEQAIAAVEPGSGGVFWQPYLNGERAPFYSPDARAGFFGISPHTTRAELQRAVFEGLAFAIVDALQGYPQGGELYLTGGGAASATWLQIIADCTGRTVVSSAFNELSARGAAILAARSVAALAETPPLAQTRYQPRPQAHARYAALYPVYRLLREQMLPVWQARQAALQPLSQDLQP